MYSNINVNTLHDCICEYKEIKQWTLRITLSMTAYVFNLFCAWFISQSEYKSTFVLSTLSSEQPYGLQ